DRFLPDTAIDLIDEAGSRVHLRNSQSSPNKELKRELAGVTKSKEAAVRVQDFDKAGSLRDQELELAQQLQATFAQNGQPVNSNVVDEEDIAQ
ncbi:MAG: UvrB/UvrC motif-containing protein, partial [Nostoc sp.]